MRVQVSLDGADGLIGLMQQLAAEEVTAAARIGLDAAAEPIVEKAQEFVPVDTGTLKKSIKVRAAKRRKRGEVRRVVGPTALAKDGTRYGYVVERRKPYLRPAFDVTGERAGDLAVKEIADEIERRWAAGRS